MCYVFKYLAVALHSALSGYVDRNASLYVLPAPVLLRTLTKPVWRALAGWFVRNALTVSSLSLQHSNPGHAGPFPVVSVHNTTINPTSPTTATMASANRGPTSPSVSAIELIPSVTNPENLPSLPDIPPIQVSGADRAVGEALICFPSVSVFIWISLLVCGIVLLFIISSWRIKIFSPWLGHHAAVFAVWGWPARPALAVRLISRLSYSKIDRLINPKNCVHSILPQDDRMGRYR